MDTSYFEKWASEELPEAAFYEALYEAEEAEAARGVPESSSDES